MAKPARYSELGAKVSVTVPDVPAGTTQPCCHPLTATGVSRFPALVCATQPRVDALRHHQHPRRGRLGYAHLTAGRAPRPGSGGPLRRGRRGGRKWPGQLRAVDDELRPGTDQ